MYGSVGVAHQSVSIGCDECSLLGREVEEYAVHNGSQFVLGGAEDCF